MTKIFGIGWAKTGTSTLGECLKILGYNHQSKNFNLVKDIKSGNLTKIIALAKEKETFEDWPWIIVYKEMDKAFPNSKFILTIRDCDKWICSYLNMLENQGKASEDEIRRIIYGLPFPNVTKQQLIERYMKHNREVMGYFQYRPKDLLVVNWEKDDGWQKLCNFVGKPTPYLAFPHANKGQYAKIKKQIKKVL